MRGVGAELDRGLIGGLSEVRQKVADLLLAGIDDLTGGRLVDGGGHLLTQVLEASTQLFQKDVRRQGRFGRHRRLRRGKRISDTVSCAAELPFQRRRSRKFCHTRRLSGAGFHLHAPAAPGNENPRSV